MIAPVGVARGDQIVALLADASDPMSTAEVGRLAGAEDAAYLTLRRLAREGLVIKLRFANDRAVYWRLSALTRAEVAGLLARLEESFAAAD